MSPTGPLCRAAEVRRAEVANGLLLVDPLLVRAHGLNATATVIWDALDGEPDTETVVDRVATVFGLDPGSVRDAVVGTLEQFVDEGLVTPNGGSGAPRAAPTVIPGRFPNVPSTDEVVPDRHAELPWRPPLGPFRGLDATFDLITTDADIGRYLAAVWAPLAMAAASPAPERVRRYSISDSDIDPSPSLLLALDGRVVARVGSGSSAVALAIWHANQLISTETTRLLQVHASAVTIDGATVVLPAVMNSGKSTLATALVAAGGGYLTDEAVAIDPGTGLVLPYPKAITLDPGSWTLFADLEPQLVRDLPRLHHAKWYVHPDAVRPGAIAPAAAPSTLVFPVYDPERPTLLEPVAPVDAAAELARHCFNLAAMGQVGVDLIARLASTIPCATLSVHDLDSGVAALRAAARAAAAP